MGVGQNNSSKVVQKNKLGHNYRDVGGTSPWTGEGRTMQEQLSRITSGTVIESTVFSNIRNNWYLTLIIMREDK